MAQDKLLDLGQQVNRVGKYLYRHIDGAYKIKFSPVTCDIYFTMYYQIPQEKDTFKELNLDINITTYQKKLRINVTELDANEKTICQIILSPGQIEDLNQLYRDVYLKIQIAVAKEFSEFDFVY